MRASAKETERVYTKLPEVAHCPKCRRPVKLPAFLKSATVNGRIRVLCPCQRGAVIVVSGIPPTGEEFIGGT